MILSENTITILKNFSSINPSIYIRPGNVIRTITVAGNIAATAVIQEEFETDFAIYDLHEFLNGLKLYDNPTLDFSTNNRIIIRQGRQKIEYGIIDPSLITYPENRDIKLPTVDISFSFQQAEFDKLIRASSVFNLPDFSVVGNGKTISLEVSQKGNVNTNKVSVEVGDTDSEFVMYYRVENLKLIPGNYDVEISKHLVSSFTNKDFELKYNVGLESDSSFYS